VLQRCAFTLACLVVPRLALACPVCFGRSDSREAVAINLGIFMLLGVIGSVLAGFAIFMVYLNRRARQFAETSATPTPPDSGALGRVDLQEGTAC